MATQYRYLCYKAITDGGLNNQLDNFFSDSNLSSCYENMLIVLLKQMADFADNSKGEFIMTYLEENYGLTESDITDIVNNFYSG